MTESAPGNFGQLKMTLAAFARSETMQCESVTVGARVVVPLDGFDSYQKRPDGPFIDEDADTAFCDELCRALRADIACERLPLNINDPAFADHVAERFVGLWNAAGRGEGRVP